MKIKLEYKTDPAREVVDLTDFGFPADKNWDTLNIAEQKMVIESCKGLVKVEVKALTNTK